MEEEKSVNLLSPKPDLDARIFAAISYLSVLFIVPWVIKRDDGFVMFHVRQGLALFIAEIVVWFILWLLEALLTTVFSFGAYSFMVFFYRLAWLLFAAVSLAGAYFAAAGAKKELKWLGVIAKNLKV